MKKNDLLFSVLVPVYNVEKYLRQCLNSLIQQCPFQYEVILVDDGSTDSSGKICDEYQKRYSKIFNVIHKNNEGLLLARRTGIKAAKGEYFVFVDSDDFVSETLLNDLFEIINKKAPDLVIYHADGYKNGSFFPFRRPFLDESRMLSARDRIMYYEATLKHTVSNSIWCKAVNRKYVDINKDYSAYPVFLGEDLLQTLPYITYSNSIFYLNKVLYHYRMNETSMTHVMNYAVYDSLRTVNIELEKYAKNWCCDNTEKLVAGHYIDDAWTVLSMLAKSNSSLYSDLTNSLLIEMSDDGDFQKKFHVVEKDIPVYKRIILRMLYSGRVQMLKPLLALLRLGVKFI